MKSTGKNQGVEESKVAEEIVVQRMSTDVIKWETTKILLH